MLHTIKSWLWAIEDRLTIRGQIGIATAALCIALAVSLAGIAALVSRNKIESLISERMEKGAVTLADQLDRYMFERRREIRMLADLGEFHDDWKDQPAKVRAMLDHVQANFPDYAWLGFVDARGTVLAATKGMLEGVSVAKRDWFVKGLKQITVEDVHEAVLLSKLLGAAANGEPHRFVDVAVPIKGPNGETIGVLGAHVNWKWTDDLRRVLSFPDADGGVTDFVILAGDGSVLLGPNVGSKLLPPERITHVGKTMRGTFVDQGNGEAMLTGYAVTRGHRDYEGLSWIVLARRPAASALAASRDIAWAILGFGVLAGILGVLLAIAIAHRAARSLKTLISEADRIGRDAKVTMLPRLRGSREVIKLTRALRALLRRVGFAEERTRVAELRESENARQFAHDLRTLRELADTDPLTHLMNRRSFLEVGHDAMQYFKRYHRSIATFVIDIDKFKEVNDRYGHAAGDAVIKRVGEVIESLIRTTDKVARFGGEEFVVLLREVDEENARRLAERIRQRIEQAPVVFGQTAIGVSVSIGVALAAEHDRDIDDVIERADKGLYMAKNTGRNRIFFMPAISEELQQRVA